jgi:hypothetical protein
MRDMKTRLLLFFKKLNHGRPQASDRTPKQGRGSQSARGQRELRGLQSSVNYDTQSASRRTKRERVMMLSL